MHSYKSDVILGEEYRDRITGLEGVADSVHFYRNSCERVRLIYAHDGDVKDISVDAADLVRVDDPAAAMRSTRPGGPDRGTPPAR